MKRSLKKLCVCISVFLCTVILCQSVFAGLWYYKIDYNRKYNKNGIYAEMAKIKMATGGSFNRIYTSKNVTKNRYYISSTTTVAFTNGKKLYYAKKEGRYITIYRYNFTNDTFKKIVKCKKPFN